jgi:hypothetical protein
MDLKRLTTDVDYIDYIHVDTNIEDHNCMIVSNYNFEMDLYMMNNNCSYVCTDNLLMDHVFDNSMEAV